jgi:peptidoglycan/LPS O-acetylase OafA/YrhL
MKEPNTITKRHYILDGARGAAALSVCLYHYFSWSEVLVVESAGLFSVAIFFVLSALTLSFTYRDRFQKDLRVETLREFYQNRAARILPLLAFVALLRFIYALVQYENIGNEFIRFFLTASGLFAFQQPGYLSSFVGAWSLGLEIWFYLLFPIIFLLTKNLRLQVVVFVILLLLFAQQALIILLVNERLSTLGRSEYWYSFASPLIYAPFFAMGILIDRTQFEARKIYSIVGTAMFVFSIGFSLIWSTPIITNNVYFSFLGVCCGLSIFLLYHSTCPEWLVPLMRFGGEISYALYLIHWIVWYALAPVAQKMVIPNTVLIPVALISSIVLASVIHRMLELPMQRLLRFKLG